LPDTLTKPLFPIIVIPLDEQYQIVYGFREFDHYQENEIAQIPAIVLPANYPLLDILRSILTVHCRYQALLPIDIARIIRFLHDNSRSYEEIQTALYPLLDRSRQAYSPTEYERLSDLPESLVRYLIDKRAPLKTWFFLGTRPTEFHGFFEMLLQQTQPSLSVLQEMAQNLQEIARRREISASQLIEDLQLIPTINNEKAASQKLATLRKILYSARYPQLSHHQQKIRARAERIPLPGNSQIQYDESFERKEIRLTTIFRSPADLERYAEQMTGKVYEQLRQLLRDL